MTRMEFCWPGPLTVLGGDTAYCAAVWPAGKALGEVTQAGKILAADAPVRSAPMAQS
jgi:hypothetical protein